MDTEVIISVISVIMDFAEIKSIMRLSRTSKDIQAAISNYKTLYYLQMAKYIKSISFPDYQVSSRIFTLKYIDIFPTKVLMLQWLNQYGYSNKTYKSFVGQKFAINNTGNAKLSNLKSLHPNLLSKYMEENNIIDNDFNYFYNLIKKKQLISDGIKW